MPDSIIKVDNKHSFNALRKKSKATGDQQLIGYKLEKNFLGFLKEVPVLMPESEIEKGVLLCGSCRKDMSLSKDAYIFNQVKKGMGGLILSSWDSHAGVDQVSKLMEEVRRRDLVVFNGIDTDNNVAIWDFFQNATTEEIVSFLTTYLQEHYEENIVELITPVIKHFFEYYEKKDKTLSLSNIEKYMNFTAVYSEAMEHAYCVDGSHCILDREFIDLLQEHEPSGKKLLLTAQAILHNCYEGIMLFCQGLRFTNEEIDFRQNILENKIIYAFGPVGSDQVAEAKAFERLVLSRYLKALEDLTHEYIPTALYINEKPQFLVYNSSLARKDKAEIELITSAIKNERLYTVYMTNDLFDESRHPDLLTAFQTLPNRLVKKVFDPEQCLKVVLNYDSRINQRDLMQQDPDKGHMVSGYYDIERIKSAYVLGMPNHNSDEFKCEDI